MHITDIVLHTATFLMLVVLPWAIWCMWKSDQDFDQINNDSYTYFTGSGYQGPLRWTLASDMAFEERCRVMPRRHFWRKLTFRNPWVLYGPITISLIYGFDMDEKFWNCYKFIYLKYDTEFFKRTICRKMLALKTWRGGNASPLPFILASKFDLYIADHMPKEERIDMSDGVAEYDQAMIAQETMERI